MRDWYELAKPGLVYGNLLTVIAGFLVGTAAIGATSVDLLLLCATIVGIALVMASGCVFNNALDAKLDEAMARTKDRALVARRISKAGAMVYGIALGAIGFGLLAWRTNIAAVAAATIGWIVYVVFYTLWAKRQTIHGALVGSIAGGVPPVVGYAAATWRWDLGAALLFIMLVLWQMPHFYAIGLYRFRDYRAANLPIYPVRKGLAASRRAMIFYIFAFILSALLLAAFGYAGELYGSIAAICSFTWLVLGFKGFRLGNHYEGNDSPIRIWARKMFFASLITMSAVFLALTADALLKIY